jgi:hypothetical protein
MKIKAKKRYFIKKYKNIQIPINWDKNLYQFAIDQQVNNLLKTVSSIKQ